MPPNNSVGFTITATDKASQTVEKVRLSVGDLAKGFVAGGLATDALRAGMNFLTSQVTSSVAAWNESEKASAQLNAVLKSTNGVIGMSAQELEGLASSLQATTTYEDEAILGAESLLLTFTNIGKDIFPQVTQTVLDMSTALGQDLKSSAIQLGKALQDPILGVTALRKVGVNFSEAQTDVIKKLVETGRAADAQKLILKELATEFGGSATAQAKTFEGQMTQLKNRMDDFKETIGHGFTSAMSNVLVSFNQVTTSQGKTADAGKQVFQTFAYITQFAANTATGIHFLFGSFVIGASFIGQAIAALNGFDEAEKQFFADFREEVASGIDETKEFALTLAENNQQTIADWGKITEASNGAGGAGAAAYEATGKAAEEAAKKIEDANKAVEETEKKLTELLEQQTNDIREQSASYAEAIVSQEEKVKELKKQLREAEREDKSSRDVDELQDAYDREKKSLDEKKILYTAFDDEVAEVRRRNALTDFEREIEDITRRGGELQKEFAKKLALIQAELAENQKKRLALDGIENGITADLGVQIASRTTTTAAFSLFQVKEATKVEKAWQNAFRATSLVSSASSGASSSKRSVNDAIITPQGQVIETHPNDYIIATKTPNALGGGQTINVTITGNTLLDAQSAEKIGDLIIKSLKREQRISIV